MQQSGATVPCGGLDRRNTFFAKHYRDGGAGCRYIGDLWLWRRNYPDMDEIYIRDVLKKMHLEVFYDNILALQDYWFADAPGSEVLDVMTEFIFSSGSWGLEEIRVLSRSVRNAKHHDLGFSGRLLYLFEIAFPSVEVLRNKYRILKKPPGCCLWYGWCVLSISCSLNGGDSENK